MRIAQKLDNALSEINAEFYSDFYLGEGEDYGYYDQLTDTPDGFGDDEAEFEIQSGIVHFFTKTEQNFKKEKIKKLLREAGFKLGQSYEQHESDTGYTHFSFEFETFRAISQEE